MREQVLIGLAAIVALGVSAQWAASRVRVPALLLLLAFGLTAGPVTGLLDPNALLGELLLPVVSLSVAVILFEGGLSLKLQELRSIGRVLLLLTTLGAAITWLTGAVAAHYLLDFGWPVAALLGAVLVVTGPTVINPLLRHLHLRGQMAALLKWEGIVIDPIGAVLAVLIFRVVQAEASRHGVAGDVALTLLVGGGSGIIGGGLLVFLLRRYWVPDSLHNAVTLMMVFGLFAVCNHLQSESGLLAVTAMGVVLANQKSVPIKHIVEFKENLSVLLVSSLFIILAARLTREQIYALDYRALLFLAALIVVARPAAMLASAIGSKLTWRERLFGCCMAPRGIVAAAVTSVFALEMDRVQHPEAAMLVPITFLVIIGTVTLYGLSAAPLASGLGLANPNPQGVLFVGAHTWARSLALALKAEDCPVLVADSTRSNVTASRLATLPAYFGSVLSVHAQDEMELGEMGKLVCITPNDEVNSLACLRFVEFFGRQGVYQLPFKTGDAGRREAVSHEQRGRFMLGLTYAELAGRFGDNPTVKTTRLSKEFDYEAFQKQYGDAALPVFLISENREVSVFNADNPPTPKPGQTIISLLEPGFTPPQKIAEDKTPAVA